MAFQIKQIHFLVSKKAAARKQKRYDTGYALTANKLHSSRTGGFPQCLPLQPHRDPDGQYPPAPPHLTYVAIPRSKWKRGGHMEM